ncbi:hypothetical protein DSO57_1004928 [Entomophthora muscae]|uniref:Uncharacterized protein n=1 Tax=Entomophthora muscae TaxID=34485 RepID=A0ACC2T8T1_9FUNG|nr:hypothetical protein DSO57_1004928 [Entomophthora muscae]
MSHPSSSVRPAARIDWEEQADDALKSIWSATSSLDSANRSLKRTGSLPTPPCSTPGRRVRRNSEDSSAFAQAIKDTANPFTLNLHPNNITTASRSPSLPTSVQASTSQLGLFNNDASLKHARRRIRLASDFDQMLANGFPNLNHSEPTLYISLTPKVASQPLPIANN